MGKFCTNCGDPLKEGAKFCGNCGTAVEQALQRPETAAIRTETVSRRPYRPTEPRKLQSEMRREAPVQARQSSGGGFWHFLAGTAMGAFLGNLFGSSASAQAATVVNHNETIINEHDDEEEWVDDSVGERFDDEDWSEDTDYDEDYEDDYADDDRDYDDDDDSYDDSYDDGYDGGNSDSFFDDFGGGDDFGGDDSF